MISSFFDRHNFITAEKINKEELIASLLSEIKGGLEGRESSLMMVPSFCGVEGEIREGEKIAVLDAGGTNFRGGVVSFPRVITHKQNQPMPGSARRVSAREFYDALSNEVKRLKEKATTNKVGWCFSYPAKATRALDAQLVRWTKNIDAPEIVNRFIGEDLSSFLNDGTRFVIVNDTVATLLAAKANKKTYSSYIGFILGTGTNVAYVEKNSEIKKCNDLPLGKMIINAESGAFNKCPQSDFDLVVDKESLNFGEQRFEKMIAGAYLGDIALAIWRKAADEGLLSSAPKIKNLSTVDLDAFCANEIKLFENEKDTTLAQNFARAVYERAATLSAIHLAAFAIKTGEGFDAPIAIIIDGSTYYKTRAISFEAIVKRELNSILSPLAIKFEILPQVEDAPMIGAAIAASAFS